MEKLTLTKDKLQAVVQILTSLIFQIENEIIYQKDWPRILSNAHLFFFREFSRKVRKKLINLEDARGDKRVRYQIDPMQAAVLLSHRDKVKADSPGMDAYAYGVFVEISGQLFKKLLS